MIGYILDGYVNNDYCIQGKRDGPRCSKGYLNN